MVSNPDFKTQALNWQAIYFISKAISLLCWKIVLQYLKNSKIMNNGFFITKMRTKIFMSLLPGIFLHLIA